MATIGLSKPFYAIYTASGEAVSYTSDGVLGKAVELSMELEGGDANILYADNGPAESATTFGGGTLTNFAALLFTSDWNIYNPDCPAEKISTAAADFGFNMFSQGWRLYKTGYDYGPGDNDPRMYSFIPLIGDYSATKKAGWRIWNQSREANMRTNGGFDFGNGCGGAVRCVKNYKK